MSKFSAAEHEEIMRQARKTVARHEIERSQPPKPRVRETEWRLPEPEPPPEYVAGLDTTAPRVDSREIDRRIAAAVAKARKEWRGEIEGARAFIFEVLGEALGKCWEAQRDDAAAELGDAVRGLNEAFSKLKVEICEMRLDLARAKESAAIEKLKTIDLPAVPSTRRTDIN
jgi:hypothetical protein